MFRSLLIISFLLLTSVTALAQKPVNWTYSIEKMGDLENTFQLKFIAKINDKWHMYSQHLPNPDDGPLPTIFGFDEHDNVEYIGVVEEEKEKMHSQVDEAFGVMVNYYDGEVTFTQIVKLKEGFKTMVTGFVSYMVCDDAMCLPPEDFDFRITVEP